MSQYRAPGSSSAASFPAVHQSRTSGAFERVIRRLLTWEEAKAISTTEKGGKIFASVAFTWTTRLSRIIRYKKKREWRADVRVDGNGRWRLNMWKVFCASHQAFKMRMQEDWIQAGQVEFSSLLPYLFCKSIYLRCKVDFIPVECLLSFKTWTQID